MAGIDAFADICQPIALTETGLQQGLDLMPVHRYQVDMTLRVHFHTDERIIRPT